MVVTCTPTANNSIIMAEVGGESKEAVAACIFLQYCICPITLTAWLSIFTYMSANYF